MTTITTKNNICILYLLIKYACTRLYFMSIKIEAINIILSNKGQWLDIEREAGISKWWLQKMAYRPPTNPQLDLLEKIIKWEKDKAL